MTTERAKASVGWKEYSVVALLWFFFTAAWYAYLGVHFDIEAEKYIEEAQYVLQHHQFSAARFLFYSTTTAVIAFAQLTGIGLYGALFLIMGINLLSYLYFFKALRFVFANRVTPLLTVLLMLGFWPYQSWSLYLYTESFFYSVVVVLLAQLLQFQRLTARYVLITLLLLFLVVLSRPLGILFVPPVLLFFFLQLTKKQRLYFLAAAIIAAVALNYIVQVVFTSTRDWNMQRAITEGDIICDIPGELATNLDLTDHPNQLYRLFYYVTHNVAHFIGLALTRLRFFFGMVRSYYSGSHNAFLVANLALWYSCVLLGVKRIHRRVPVAVFWFMLASILLFALTIALQCDDYHNRFFLTLTPFFTLMTAAVLAPVISRLSFFSAPRRG